VSTLKVIYSIYVRIVSMQPVLSKNYSSYKKFVGHVKCKADEDAQVYFGPLCCSICLMKHGKIIHVFVQLR
jgi:hypothetical protein